MVNIETLYVHMEDLGFKHIDSALTQMIAYGENSNTPTTSKVIMMVWNGNNFRNTSTPEQYVNDVVDGIVTSQNGTVSIDWGDTNVVEDITNEKIFTHTYSTNENHNINISGDIINIGAYTFNGNLGLISVTIPQGVGLDEYSFSDCTNLTSVTLPSDLTEIPNYCFKGTGLTSIIIPSSVTRMGQSPFSDTTGLSQITFESTVPPVLSETLSLSSNTVIRVPQGSLSTYQSSPGYPDYVTYVEY